MTRLLRVEAARLLARRAVLVLLLAAIVIPAVFAVARAIDTRPPSDAQLAEWEQMAADEADRPYVQRSYRQCLEKPRQWGVAGAEDVEAACKEATYPTAEWYGWYQPLRLGEEREGSGVAVVVVLSMLMLILGTTFAGHDWASGSMSNQLLFEPRRGRVWAAKAAAVTILALLLAAVVTTAYWLVLAAVIRSRDGNVTSANVLDSLQQGWRGAGLAAAAALAGYALAMLFRSTVASLGLLAGVAVAGGILLATLGVAGSWDPALNAFAVIQDGATYWEDGLCPDGSPGCSVERTVPLGHGVTLLGSALVVGVAVSMLSFRRRDVP